MTLEQPRSTLAGAQSARAPSVAANNIAHALLGPRRPLDDREEQAASKFEAGTAELPRTPRVATGTAPPDIRPNFGGLGRPLPEFIKHRLKLTGAPERNLDAIRVHDNPTALDLARLHGARGLSFGTDIAVRPQASAAATERLICHEAYHAARPQPVISLSPEAALRSILEHHDDAFFDESVLDPLALEDLLWIKTRVCPSLPQLALDSVLPKIDSRIAALAPGRDDLLGACEVVSPPVENPPPQITGPEAVNLIRERNAIDIDLLEGLAPSTLIFVKQQLLLLDNASINAYVIDDLICEQLGAYYGRDEALVFAGCADPRGYTEDKGFSEEASAEGVLGDELGREDEQPGYAHRPGAREHPRYDYSNQVLAARSRIRVRRISDPAFKRVNTKFLDQRGMPKELVTLESKYKELEDLQVRHQLRLDQQNMLNRAVEIEEQLWSLAQASEELLDQLHELRHSSGGLGGGDRERHRRELLIGLETVTKQISELEDEQALLDLEIESSLARIERGYDSTHREKSKDLVDRAVKARERNQLPRLRKDIAKLEKTASWKVQGRLGRDHAEAEELVNTTSATLMELYTQRDALAMSRGTTAEDLAEIDAQITGTTKLLEQAVAGRRELEQLMDEELTIDAEQYEVSIGDESVLIRRDKSQTEARFVVEGTLLYREEDLEAGYSLATGSASNFGLARDELAFVMDLFQTSEGRPDSLLTRSRLGITLGPGFTGNKLARVMHSLSVDDPEAYARMFGNFGIEVKPTKAGGNKFEITVTIPSEDQDRSSMVTEHDREPLPSDIQYGTTRLAADAFDIIRKDIKLLGAVGLAAHAPEFRAQYVKLIYQQLEDARNYQLTVGDFSIAWGDIPRDHFDDSISWKNDPVFNTVWLLPYLDGFMATSGGGVFLDKARDFLAEELRGTGDQLEFYADQTLRYRADEVWRAAAARTLAAKGDMKRIAIIERRFGDRPWFRWLIEGS